MFVHLTAVSSLICFFTSKNVSFAMQMFGWNWRWKFNAAFHRLSQNSAKSLGSDQVHETVGSICQIEEIIYENFRPVETWKICFLADIGVNNCWKIAKKVNQKNYKYSFRCSSSFVTNCFVSKNFFFSLNCFYSNNSHDRKCDDH